MQWKEISGAVGLKNMKQFFIHENNSGKRGFI